MRCFGIFLYYFIGILLFLSTTVAGEPVHRLYTNEDGLLSSFVKHITQLPAGQIAVSTDGGLGFYDGYEFHKRTVSDGLPDNYVKQTIIDQNDRIVVATDRGIGVADLHNDRIPLSFRSVEFEPVDDDPRIRSIYQARNGNIYLAGPNNIYLMDDQDRIHPIPFTFRHESQFDFFRSYTFQEDRMGGILITSIGNNLLYIPPGETHVDQISGTGLPDQLREIKHISDDRYLIGGNNGIYVIDWNPGQRQVRNSEFIENSRGLEIDDITKQEDHRYLIGTGGDGLFQLDLKSGNLTKSRDFFSEFIKHVHFDANDNQWIATDHGLVFIPNVPFGNIGPEDGLPRRFVSDVLRDRQNQLWIATHEGIFYRDHDGKSLQKLEYLDQSLINAIRYVAHTDQIHVFTTHEIHEINPNTGTGRLMTSLSSDLNIQNIALTREGHFWLVDNSGDLLFLDRETGELTEFGSDQEVTENITGITITPDESVWISGDSRFLAYRNPGSNTFHPVDWENYPTAPPENSRLSYLLAGDEHDLWIGGPGGVYILDMSQNDQEPHLHRVLESGPVQWIEKLGNDRWVGTNQKLYQISRSANDPRHTIRSFSTANGLTSTGFNYDAVSTDHQGYLWIGTNVGVIYHDGGDILKEASPVRLQYWQAGEKVFTEADDQQFRHNVNRFTFSFSTFDYPAEDILYQSRILGADEEWSEPLSTPEFTRYLFGSGSYTFEVRASRSSNIWTEPLQISFVILRPWWWSNLMIGVYILLIAGAVFGYVRWRSGKLRRRNKILADNIRQRTRHLTQTVNNLEKEIQERRCVEKQLKDSNDTKEQLIRIISHDLRSPFQGIVGFASMLRDQYQDFSDKERKEIIDHIINSSEKAVTLLNQLLDWASLQSGKMPFEPDWLDLRKSVTDVSQLLNSMAGSKQIAIQNKISDEQRVYADEGMLQTMLRNLTSNAIKFTPVEGVVTISAEDKVDATEIRVSDNGVGMDQKTLDQILNTREVVSTRGTGKERGSGLGLVMCKEMVEQHGGRLTGKSKEGEGTMFIITLPRPS